MFLNVLPCCISFQGTADHLRRLLPSARGFSLELPHKILFGKEQLGCVHPETLTTALHLAKVLQDFRQFF